MRLFIAINFSEGIKQKLYNVVKELENGACSGTFTRKENLHLTLAFIGETDKLTNVRRAMKQVAFDGFELKFSGTIGAFHRGGRDTYWLGIEKNQQLQALQRDVSASLEKFGFVMEKRKFTPHLTLGREVVFKGALPQTTAVTAPVKRICLMKSERIRGVLKYTPLFEVEEQKK